MTDTRSMMQIRKDVIAMTEHTDLALMETALDTAQALINCRAERDRLRAVNAAMLAALKAVESITRDLPLPSVHNVINHAITAASEETT